MTGLRAIPLDVRAVEGKKQQLTSQCLSTEKKNTKKNTKTLFFGGVGRWRSKLFADFRFSRWGRGSSNLTPAEKRGMVLCPNCVIFINLIPITMFRQCSVSLFGVRHFTGSKFLL